MQIPDFGDCNFPQAMRRRCSPPGAVFPRAWFCWSSLAIGHQGQMDALYKRRRWAAGRCAPRPANLAQKDIVDLSRRTVHAGRRGAPSWRCRTPAPAGATDKGAASRIDRGAGCACPVPGAGAPRVSWGSGRRRVVARAGWLSGGEAVASFRVRCMRSWRPFCSGWPGLDTLRADAQPDPPHRTAATAGRRAGGRRATVIGAHGPGQPVLANAASKIARTRSLSVFSTAWQRQQIAARGCRRWSADRMRSPSPLRSQPLKSPDHSSLGSPADANGCV